MAAAYSHARKFDFKNESFAGYFRTSLGQSALGKSVYENSSGANTTFADAVDYNFSGEFGFSFAPHDAVVVRLGWEALQARPQEAIDGDKADGTKLMAVTSTVLVLQPVATLEMNISKDIESRWFVFVGTGSSSMDVDNAYAFTTPGTTEYPAVAGDYTEKSEASLLSTHYGVGYETLMVDNVTATFELGYRNLNATGLKYRFDHTGSETTLQGDKAKGATVVNDDATNRGVNMSGVYLGVMFRFYISTN